MSDSDTSSQKIALVTGANRGIGLEVMKQLAELGIYVIATSRDMDAGASLQAELQGQGLAAKQNW